MCQEGGGCEGGKKDAEALMVAGRDGGRDE